MWSRLPFPGLHADLLILSPGCIYESHEEVSKFTWTLILVFFLIFGVVFTLLGDSIVLKIATLSPNSKLGVSTDLLDQ